MIFIHTSALFRLRNLKKKKRREEILLKQLRCSKIWGHGSDAHILPLSQLTHKPGCSLGVEIDTTLLENSYFNHWGQGDGCSAAPSRGQLPTQTTSPQGSHDWFSLLRQSQLLYPPVPRLHSTRHNCEFISLCITI